MIYLLLENNTIVTCLEEDLDGVYVGTNHMFAYVFLRGRQIPYRVKAGWGTSELGKYLELDLQLGAFTKLPMWL